MENEQTIDYTAERDGLKSIRANSFVLKTALIIKKIHTELLIDRVTKEVDTMLGSGLDKDRYQFHTLNELRTAFAKLQANRDRVFELLRKFTKAAMKVKSLKGIVEAYLYEFDEVRLQPNKEQREAASTCVLKEIEDLYSDIISSKEWLSVTNDDLTARYYTLKEMAELFRAEIKNTINV